MKTKKNWFVIVAAMIMSSVMIFASCSSDDDPMLPEVIESEVLDKGMDDTASSKPSINPNGVTTGTQFSYKSWIMVKGQTRAAFENKVEVTLNNVFANTDTVITVSNFDLGDYKTVVSKRKRSERQEGFVTVSDSVMVYSVQFAEFSFDYELDFEHAVYNDGVTKQNMPYHPIGTIKDNGYKLNDLEFIIETDKNVRERVYLRKLLTHSISVEFNGKSYDLTAKVELQRFAGFYPCIVESVVTDEGKEIIDININDVVPSISFKSWISVQRSWLDNRKEEKTFTQICTPEICISEQSKFYKIIPDTDIIRENAEIEYLGTKTSVTGADSEYTKTIVALKQYTITYNYFDVIYTLKEPTPVYNDGVLSKNMPAYSLSNIRHGFTLEGPADDYTNGRPAWGYIFYQTLEFMFDEQKVGITDDISLYVYKL